MLVAKNPATGAWVCVCDAGCGAEWTWAQSTLHGMTAETKWMPTTRQSPAAASCIVCHACGFQLRVPIHCLVHSPGECPPFIWESSIQADVWVTNYKRLTADDEVPEWAWYEAEQLASRYDESGAKIARRMTQDRPPEP